MRNVLLRPFDIRAGNALMYFPEANVLVPRAVDGLSRTPAFKKVLVSVKNDSAPSTETGGRVSLELVGR